MQRHKRRSVRVEADVQRRMHRGLHRSVCLETYVQMHMCRGVYINMCVDCIIYVQFLYLMRPLSLKPNCHTSLLPSPWQFTPCTSLWHLQTLSFLSSISSPYLSFCLISFHTFRNSNSSLLLQLDVGTFACSEVVVAVSPQQILVEICNGLKVPSAVIIYIYMF